MALKQQHGGQQHHEELHSCVEIRRDVRMFLNNYMKKFEILTEKCITP